jgi:tetratricopeptide (TPR) repeat protein
LSNRYAKEPNNVEVVFKLARKFEEREHTGSKAKELYRRVISLDPAGKAGAYYNDYLKSFIACTEAAEEALARTAFFGPENDPGPLRAFIAKYPESKFLKDEYALLASFYYLRDSVPKDEATKFFSQYASKFPHSAEALSAYVERIINDKEPLDKGIELAERIREMVGDSPNPGYVRNLAQLYVLNGDLEKADEVYGKDFIDETVLSMVYWLTGYANFWIEQKKNLESAESMADLAAKIAPVSQSPQLQSVASIYLKLNKTDKALKVYGPEFLRKHLAEEAVLWGYATFWSRHETNLDSALEAARKSVELNSDVFNNYNLATILLKLKKYEEALKAAEKTVELAKLMAAKNKGFPTQQYESLVKQIKDVMAKKKTQALRK